MRKKRERIEWNIKAALGSKRIQQMNLAEEGAYRRALDIFYLEGFLPNNDNDIMKLIGKDCTIEIAEKVRSMFKQDTRFPLLLSHDYAERMDEDHHTEAQDLPAVNNEHRDRMRKFFHSHCDRLADDGAVFDYAVHKHRINREQYLTMLNEFRRLKLADNKYLAYANGDDIRRNFMFYMPYSDVVKNRYNEQAQRYNSKSATSGIGNW